MSFSTNGHGGDSLSGVQRELTEPLAHLTWPQSETSYIKEAKGASLGEYPTANVSTVHAHSLKDLAIAVDTHANHLLLRLKV